MASLAREPPQNCGRRLIPALVDEIARTDPHRAFASVPRANDDLSLGWQDITYRTIAIAVSRCARWIDSAIGTSSQSKILLYMGPLDLRFPIVLLAAVKTGHVAQFSSTRNSLEAHLSLVEKAKCDTILLPEDSPAITAQIIADMSLNVVHMPLMEELLAASEDNAIYPYNQSFDAVRYQPLVVLHTSGSTGVPKPVFVAHGTFATNDMHQAIQLMGGNPVFSDVMKGKRVFVAFPLFHAACLGMIMGYNTYQGMTCVLPPPGPMSVEVVDSAHSYGNVEGSLLPPSVITDIYKSSAMFENMIRHVKFLAYVGGTLAKEIGDLVAPRIRLMTLMGATETTYLPVELVRDSQYWQQIPVSSFFGHEYRPARDGLCELVIKRNKSLDLFQGAFCTFPGCDEYGMQDLYLQHPKISNYWSFSGRVDDIICFSNAEKLNPITMETVISSHTLINGIVIGGHGQFQASVLIEPKHHPASERERDEFINAIWPVVMKANRDCVAHGRIMKNFIILTDPTRPLPCAGKDTIQRNAVLKLYEHDFKELYALHTPLTTEMQPKLAEPTPGELGLAHRLQGFSNEADLQTLLGKLDALTNKFDQILSRLDQLVVQPEAPVHSTLINAGETKLRLEIFSPPAIATTSAAVMPVCRPSLTDTAPSSSIYDDSPPKQASAPSVSGILQSELLQIFNENAIVHDLTVKANFFNCGVDLL